MKTLAFILTLCCTAAPLLMRTVDALGCAKINGAISTQVENLYEIESLATQQPIIWEGYITVEMNATNIDITNLNTTTYSTCDLTDTDFLYVSSIEDFSVICEKYNINGMMVDHIELYGSGPARVDIEGLTVEVSGTIDDTTCTVTSGSIDLEMDRWFVNFEGIMPGTDMEELFNSFFTMVGPQILDVIAGVLNDEANEQFIAFLNAAYGFYNDIALTGPVCVVPTHDGEIKMVHETVESLIKNLMKTIFQEMSQGVSLDEIDDEFNKRFLELALLRNLNRL